MRGFATVTLLVLACYPAIAQQDSSSLTFDAASIKPFPEGTPIQMSGCLGGPGSDDPGRINCEYTSLKMLLMKAYNVKKQEIFGPSWLDEVHFNITATLPRGATREQVSVMFRNLLADRFKMALHRESRELSVYAITVAKSGIKIKESGPAPVAATDGAQAAGVMPAIGEDGFPVLRPSVIAAGPIILYRGGRARLQAGNTKLARLAEALSNQLDRVVIDQTGLAGAYDITLNWTPDPTEPGGRARAATAADSQDETVPDINLALAMEQQLGLKLASRKIPRDTLVIDRAEKVPAAN